MLDNDDTFPATESHTDDRDAPIRRKDRLDTIAAIVGLPRTYFTKGARVAFDEGTACASRPQEPDSLKTFLGLSGADELVSLFSRIDDPAIRRTIVSLVGSIVRSSTHTS